MNAPATRTIPHTAWTDRRMAERETAIIGSNSDVRARASKKSPRNAELYGAILDLKWFGCGALHQRPEPGPRRGERRRRPSRAVSVSHRAPWLTAHTTKITPKATPLSHRPVIGLMESTRGSVIGAEAMARYSRVRYGNKTAREIPPAIQMAAATRGAVAHIWIPANSAKTPVLSVWKNIDHTIRVGGIDRKS